MKHLILALSLVLGCAEIASAQLYTLDFQVTMAEHSTSSSLANSSASVPLSTTFRYQTVVDTANGANVSSYADTAHFPNFDVPYRGKAAAIGEYGNPQPAPLLHFAPSYLTPITSPADPGSITAPIGTVSGSEGTTGGGGVIITTGSGAAYQLLPVTSALTMNAQANTPPQHVLPETPYSEGLMSLLQSYLPSGVMAGNSTSAMLSRCFTGWPAAAGAGYTPNTQESFSISSSSYATFDTAGGKVSIGYDRYVSGSTDLGAADLVDGLQADDLKAALQKYLGKKLSFGEGFSYLRLVDAGDPNDYSDDVYDFSSENYWGTATLLSVTPTVATPLPAALPLLGMGLAGIFGVGRRRLA